VRVESKTAVEEWCKGELEGKLARLGGDTGEWAFHTAKFFLERRVVHFLTHH